MTTPTPPTPPGPPNRQAGKLALYDAWSKVVDEAREKAAEAKAPAPPVRRDPKAWLAGALSLACVAAWGLAPIGGVAAPADPPEVRAAGLRVAVYIVGKRIEGYRRANGRIPRTLGDLGDTPAGINYLVLGSDRYELMAAGRADTVVYRSTETLEDFLGNARSYFHQPPPPRR